MLLVSMVFICVPSFKYVTLATNNVYKFSIWDFIITLINPKTNLVVSNYLFNSNTSMVCQAIAVFGILFLVTNLVTFVVLINEQINEKLKYSNIFICIGVIMSTVLLALGSVFVIIITKTTSVSNMGTKGFLYVGVIGIQILEILCLTLILIYNLRKIK